MSPAPIDVPDDLSRSFSGELLRPDAASYDDVRRVHNGLIDKRPGLIARCATTDDVVAAVKFCRELGLELSVRGGGHNVAGRAVTDGGVMIDLSAMKGIDVNARDRVVIAEGGVTWGEMDATTHAHGLAVPGGVVSSTGIAGLTLGGGLGWTQGRFGLSADNLLAAEVVTADGTVVVANDEDHADLFWALRGGGGNFGVVTRFTYRAHPLTTVLGGLVAYPADEAAQVLATYRAVTADAPDALSVQVGLLHVPGDDPLPAIGVPLCHCGDDEAAAEADVKALRRAGTVLVDDVGRIPYPVMNAATDPLFPRGALNYWKQAFVDEVSDGLIGVLVEAFAAVPSPMSALVVEPVHGAAARVPLDATAFPYRREGYAVLVCGQWRDPADNETNISWVRETFAALAPHVSDRRYVNYMGDEDSARAAYGPQYDRLVEVKRRYDPDNLFRLNQNVDPAHGGPTTGAALA
jgi:FAD/FMN-containing dehydrogenase